MLRLTCDGRSRRRQRGVTRGFGCQLQHRTASPRTWCPRRTSTCWTTSSLGTAGPRPLSLSIPHADAVQVGFVDGRTRVLGLSVSADELEVVRPQPVVTTEELAGLPTGRDRGRAGTRLPSRPAPRPAARGRRPADGGGAGRRSGEQRPRRPGRDDERGPRGAARASRRAPRRLRARQPAVRRRHAHRVALAADRPSAACPRSRVRPRPPGALEGRGRRPAGPPHRRRPGGRGRGRAAHPCRPPRAWSGPGTSRRRWASSSTPRSTARSPGPWPRPSRTSCWCASARRSRRPGSCGTRSSCRAACCSASAPAWTSSPAPSPGRRSGWPTPGWSGRSGSPTSRAGCGAATWSTTAGSCGSRHRRSCRSAADPAPALSGLDRGDPPGSSWSAPPQAPRSAWTMRRTSSSRPTPRRPAEHVPGTVGSAHQVDGVAGPHERLVDPDVPPPVVDAHAGEGRGHELGDAVRLAGGDDVVTGLVVPGGPHERVDVLRRPAPVPAGVEVAEHQLGRPRPSAIAATVDVILRVTKAVGRRGDSWL